MPPKSGLSLNERGFTLLEAIVALVIVASVGMACFSWINSTLDSLSRVRAHDTRGMAVRNALAFVAVLNPMERPQGEENLGSYVIRWGSDLVEPARDGVGHPFGVSLYRVGLYNVHVRVLLDNEETASFEMRQIGYHQERTPMGDL